MRHRRISGVLCLEEKEEGLTIAGCWVHARRKYADALKTVRDKAKRKGTLAYDASKQIGAVYKLDNELAGMEPAERQHRRQIGVTLRGFCIGKHNWRLIDTVRGAKSSAIIYSITETAKANGLKGYDYVEYLLAEIPKHEDDTDRLFLDDLFPWSPNLPERCRKTNKYEVK